MPNEGGGAHSGPIHSPDLPRPIQELPSYLPWHSLAISDLVGQDMPYHHQEVAGDGDDGLEPPQARCQALKECLPVRMADHGYPGSLHHSGTNLLSSLLGDSAAIVLLA